MSYVQTWLPLDGVRGCGNNVIQQAGLYHGCRELRGQREVVGGRAEGLPTRVRAEQSPDFGDGRLRSQNGFLMTRDESCILVTYTPHAR